MRCRGPVRLPNDEMERGSQKVSRIDLIKRIVGCLLLVPALTALPVWAGAGGDGACLECHGDSGTVGEMLAIDRGDYAGTPHAEMGCSACHVSVSGSHPDDGNIPSKATCEDCHQEVAREYAASSHGGYAACRDCHDPHSVRGVTEVSGYDLNRPCAACHEDQEMNTLHAQWLPQAQLHMGALSCITCHTGSENYVITLYLIHRAPGEVFGDFALAGHEELKGLVAGGDVRNLIDTDGNRFISLEELRVFNGSSRYGSFRLQGMMAPQKVTHSFQILENRWDCSFCHASGPKAMQESFVAFPQNDETYMRVGVEKGAVLDLLNGTPDFYILGATRSETLNIIGLMILAGGLVMPIGHGTLRLLTRRNRDGKEH